MSKENIVDPFEYGVTEIFKLVFKDKYSNQFKIRVLSVFDNFSLAVEFIDIEKEVCKSLKMSQRDMGKTYIMACLITLFAKEILDTYYE